MTRKHTINVERHQSILAGAHPVKLGSTTVYVADEGGEVRLLIFAGDRLKHTSRHPSEALAISAARARLTGRV